MHSPGDTGGYCAREGVRTWYRVEGGRSPGLPLLLVHGGPGATARPFERTIGPLFAARRPVVYIDSRGAGRSDRPDEFGQYSFTELAADIEAVRHLLGIERWSIFGHSLGAATALTYAGAFPHRVSALLLCAPLIDGPRTLHANVVAKVVHAPAALRAAAQQIYQSALTREAQFEALIELIDQPARYGFQFYTPETHTVLDAIQAELADALGQPLMCPALGHGLHQSGLWQFDGFSYLPRLTMPQAVLISPFDTEVSVETVLEYAAAAGAELFVYRHSGHHPYLEESATCARHVEDFLQRHDAPATEVTEFQTPAAAAGTSRGTIFTEQGKP